MNTKETIRRAFGIDPDCQLSISDQGNSIVAHLPGRAGYPARVLEMLCAQQPAPMVACKMTNGTIRVDRRAAIPMNDIDSVNGEFEMALHVTGNRSFERCEFRWHARVKGLPTPVCLRVETPMNVAWKPFHSRSTGRMIPMPVDSDLCANFPQTPPMFSVQYLWKDAASFQRFVSETARIPAHHFLPPGLAHGQN